MKIVFMGTPEFAAICMEEILKSSHEIVCVVSVPDKPAGRGQKISRSAVSNLAIEKNIPLFQPEKLKNPEFINQLKSLQADCYVVVAFRMLPMEVWQIPSKGTFNLHASLLPQYRGAAPINWAIINGETESGVTTFLIDKKIDTGNILLQKKVQINLDDNAGDLHDKLAESGKNLIIRTLDGLEDESLKLKPQKNELNLKSAPKIFKEDCRINWNESLEKIHNFIRGLSPYPSSWTELIHQDKTYNVKIFKGHFESNIDSDKIKKSISFEKNQIIVHLKTGRYCIDELQMEGKKRMNSQDFINGLQDKSGWMVV